MFVDFLIVVLDGQLVLKLSSEISIFGLNCHSQDHFASESQILVLVPSRRVDIRGLTHPPKALLDQLSALGPTEDPTRKGCFITFNAFFYI